jgi:Zn-dependent peptidase ImmA (M78 family)
MKNTCVRKLSNEDIELKAEEVICKWFEYVLAKPLPTPLNEFCLKLKNKHNTIIQFAQDLGYTRGRKIWGFFKPEPRTICIDVSLLDTPRFSFVLAHEIGHLVLHRKLVLENKEYQIEEDTEIDFLTGKKNLITTRDWIEWQANKFASCFLMPRKTFIDAVIQTQMEMGITRNLGIVYVDKQRYSKEDFESLKERLALIYNVNKTNVEIRLNDLKLLNDQRFGEVDHISEIFKTI